MNFSRGFLFPVRVYYEDTDAGGIVYYANYLRFLERCRTEWLRSLGYDQRRLQSEHDMAFVVRSVQADFRRPARLDDELLVDLEVEKVGRASLQFRQRVFCSGVALFTARVELACVAFSTMKPKALPEWLRSSLLQTGNLV